jgi:hypothetical protein
MIHRIGLIMGVGLRCCYIEGRRRGVPKDAGYDE